MQIESFNTLSPSDAVAVLRDCCAALRWGQQVTAGRPYATADALLDAADRVWRTMHESDFLEAFDAHPKIGDPDSLKKKYAATESLARNEQQSVVLASDETIAALAALNERYQQQFGFIFIVCATGKSAEQMLALIRERLPNDRETELINAAREQGAITAIRLRKLFAD